MAGRGPVAEYERVGGSDGCPAPDKIWETGHAGGICGLCDEDLRLDDGFALLDFGRSWCRGILSRHILFGISVLDGLVGAIYPEILCRSC